MDVHALFHLAFCSYERHMESDKRDLLDPLHPISHMGPMGTCRGIGPQDPSCMIKTHGYSHRAGQQQRRPNRSPPTKQVYLGPMGLWWAPSASRGPEGTLSHEGRCDEPSAKVGTAQGPDQCRRCAGQPVQEPRLEEQ